MNGHFVDAADIIAVERLLGMEEVGDISADQCVAAIRTTLRGQPPVMSAAEAVIAVTRQTDTDKEER